MIGPQQVNKDFLLKQLNCIIVQQIENHHLVESFLKSPEKNFMKEFRGKKTLKFGMLIPFALIIYMSHQENGKNYCKYV